MTTIYSRFDSKKVSYHSDKPTLKEAVEEAVGNNACLTEANLARASLAGAKIGKIEIIGNPYFVGGIGSAGRTTTAWPTKDGLFIVCGCWHGTLGEFEARIRGEHKDKRHLDNYLTAVEYLRMLWEREKVYLLGEVT